MMGGQGTVFAYKRQNRLVTCQHVLVDTTVIGETADGPEGQVISKVPYTADVTSPYLQNLSVVAINPVNGREWPLRVMHMDPNRDLALLEFVGEPPEHRHFSGMDSPITIHAPGRLIGFPNWSHGRRVNIEPAVVTNRFPRSALQRFEINSLIRKGNSGGPMVDDLFRVAGVAQQGATQANGNNECLCVAELDTWIAAYEASLLSVPSPVAAATAASEKLA